MPDLRFEVQLKWSGRGKEGEGRLTMGDESVRYAGPENMGGKGVGASPEDLLIGAVSACYSGTLFGVLARGGLPVKQVSVRAEGIVTGYPAQTRFSRLIVHPTILGGDEAKSGEYAAAAGAAREMCFIGKSIRGNIEYELGEVKVLGGLLEQERVDELVERFYSRLIKVPYYSAMFAERKVDLDQLKERQRSFISRLAGAQPLKEEHEEVSQVQSRHPFRTTPERAEDWLGTMKEAMEEMQLEPEIQGPLLEKMRYLMNQMVETR